MTASRCSIAQRHIPIPSTIGAFLGLLLLTSMLQACASSTGSSTSTILSKSSNELLDEKSVQLRWFPVSNATSYRVEIESPTGTTIHQEEVQPSGCTHQQNDGFTSGVCTLLYQSPKLSGDYVLRLRALSKSGVSRAATIEPRPISQ